MQFHVAFVELRVLRPFAAFLAVLLVAVGSEAATISIDASTSGWFRGAGTPSPPRSGLNYAAGYNAGTIDEYRNYFVFDLSSVTTLVVAAELRLFNPIGGYDSIDATENFTLFQVSDPMSVISETGGLASFQDLGTGLSYGSQVMSASDNGAVIAIQLNVSALSAINGTNGLFVIGGAVSTLGASGQNEVVFGFSDLPNPTRTLVLTVPEPTPLALVSSSLMMLVGFRRRAAF